MSDSLWKWCNAGERHLAAGRYMFARRALETAEGLAWRRRAAAELHRLYLPLLESCRQLRYQACQGRIIIAPAIPGNIVPSAGPRPDPLAELLKQGAGTFIGIGPRALSLGWDLMIQARLTGAAVEFLGLLKRGPHWRLCSPGDFSFASGLPVQWTIDTAALAQAHPKAGMIVPLPGMGNFAPDRPEHALASESLLAAWEALALHWQTRHRVAQASPWDQMALLRRTRLIDPACEPVFMRLIELAKCTSGFI